jgi:DNA repair exonuclease SbcCD ATPase subunit
MRAQLFVVEASLAKALGRLENLRNLAGKNDRLISLARADNEHVEIVAEAYALQEQLLSDSVGSDRLVKDRDKAFAAHAEALGDRVVALRKMASSEKLSRGEFDGVCPVAGITCPARDQINSETARNTAMAALDVATAGALSEVLDKASSKLRTAEARLQVRQRLEDKIEQTNARANRLLPMLDEAKTAPPPEDPAVLRDKVSTAHEVVANLTAKRDSLRRSVGLVDSAIAEVARLSKVADEVSAEMAVHRAAMVILGPQGAQRRVAENALVEIQESANQKLAECGVDLTVEVQWSREGQGLAAQCDACGTMFPRTARAKACDRCGAARGPLLINRLEVVLSDRSGAAEDLVGLAVQFAASDWLRADRGAQWSVMSIDEPFSQLDDFNRGSLGRHLAAMLRGSYEQSFVVAHHTSLLDALPGRILVESNGKGSSVRIVA